MNNKTEEINNNEKTYYSIVLMLLNEEITPQNREYFRGVLDSMIKIYNPELQGYVLRIEDIELSKTHINTKMLLTCYYTKSIKKFKRL